jgi:tetratricopeptide (TPR) repeat protein
LSYLLARPQHLVTKEELFKAVWRDVIVTDNALTRAVSDLRTALGDDSVRPEYIQTVSRRGYRFIAPVTLGSPLPEAATRSHRARETSSLDAYRLVAEGRVRLESLDASQIAAAIVNFQRAIDLDPGYPPAYIGLANAYFWQYELSRYRAEPEKELLLLGIEKARCALRVDGLVAESHATLGYLLTAADQLQEARAATRRAVALEPDYWAHHFRLAHAVWGDERLRALQRCRDLYPEFAFAYFQIAMVHVARGSLELAEQELRRGATIQDGHAARRQRFPSNGLRWLLGLIRMRQGDPDSALLEFEQELECGAGQVYANEFAIGARTGAGFARLQQGEAERAIDAFRQALELYPIQPRAQLGLALALDRCGQRTEAQRAMSAACEQVGAVERTGRVADGAMFRAGLHAVQGRPAEAFATLKELLTTAQPGPAGWLIPIEALFESLRAAPGYDDLLTQLALRAR